MSEPTWLTSKGWRFYGEQNISLFRKHPKARNWSAARRRRLRKSRP